MTEEKGLSRIGREEAIYYESHYFNYTNDAMAFVNKHNSENTRRDYARYIKEFFDYLEQKHVSEITSLDTQRWFKWQESLGRKPNTLKTKLACLRAFFEYLKYFERIKINPASVYAITPPDVGSDPHGTALTPSEVQTLLSLPNKTEIIGARDYSLMLLMLRTFMRVSEAVTLRENDFFYQQNGWYVRLKVKGGRIYTTPIPREVKQAIDRYHFLDRKNRSLIALRSGDSRYVFMGIAEKKTRQNYNTNTHISQRQVQIIVKQYAELLFIEENIKIKRDNKKRGEGEGFMPIRTLTPHDFRRTAITRALDLGETYRRVQNGARLKSITTVQRYDQHRQALEENSILTLNYDVEKEDKLK